MIIWFHDIEVLFEKPRGRDAKFTGVRPLTNTFSWSLT